MDPVVASDMDDEVGVELSDRDLDPVIEFASEMIVRRDDGLEPELVGGLEVPVVSDDHGGRADPAELELVTESGALEKRQPRDSEPPPRGRHEHDPRQRTFPVARPVTAGRLWTIDFSRPGTAGPETAGVDAIDFPPRPGIFPVETCFPFTLISLLRRSGELRDLSVRSSPCAPRPSDVTPGR